MYICFFFVYGVRMVGIFIKFYDLKMMIGWSSIGNLVLIFLVSLVDIRWGLFLLVAYGGVFYLFVRFCWTLKVKTMFDLQIGTFQSFYKTWLFRFYLLWMVGIPPFVMFWVKVILLVFLDDCIAGSLVYFVIVLMFLQILIYVKMFSFLWKVMDQVFFSNFLKTKNRVMVLWVFIVFSFICCF